MLHVFANRSHTRTMELRKVPCLILNILPVALALVELKDFYPYGRNEGDAIVPRNDDGSSGIIDISFPFPFFDRDHNFLYVNTNGAVSFLREISQYTPDAFPLDDNRRMIAPFWADVDTRNGGQVLYRETQDRNILTRVTNEIRTLFVNQRRFSARWVMVVTWLDVAHYTSVLTSINRKYNTFQMVLASNGVNSFTIFHYNKIEWIHGAASRGTPAQAGFNAGDGLRYYNIPNSRTEAIINITSTSNINVPGKWVFQVDGDTVERGGCSFVGGKLLLSPRSGIELGGTEVYIGGPCYSPNDTIICRFNKTIQTPGVYVNPEQALCITPPLYVLGRIPIELSLDNGVTFNFNGIFTSIPLGRNPPDVQGLDINQWINSSSTQLNWNPNVLNTSRVDVEVLLFDSTNRRLSDESFKKERNIPNTGTYTLKFDDHKTGKRRRKRNIDHKTPVAIVRITPSSSVVKRALGLRRLAAKLFSSLFLIPSIVSSLSCLGWYFRDIRLHNTRKLQDELPPCPTSLRAVRAERGMFKQDPASSLKSFFHPGAEECFRSEQPSASGAGQQCCYNKNGALIVGPPGGGTLDVISPDNSKLSHFAVDVAPWLLCCKWSLVSQCDKYYSRRPSDDGSRYVPSPIAATNGDPHLVTFDGVSYTFNGKGEYLLLSIPEINLMFQGRMESLIDSNGRQTKATALTALVVKEMGSDTVQIELNPRRVMDVFINEERMDFDEQSRLDFNGVFVINGNRSKLSVFLNSGVSMDVTATEELLLHEITIPVKFKGKTAGLLGYWDDNKEKEFLLPNGIFLDTNSSSRMLHYHFGQKWIVGKNNTLFSYRLGKGYDDYLDLGFVPIFLSNSAPDFSNSTLEQEAKKICGNNKECMFDIAVSGKTKIGQTTLNSIKELRQRRNNSRITADPVYFGCDGVQDSGKTVDACGICGGNNSTCTDCDGVVKPNVVNNATCEEDNKLKFYLLVIGIPAVVVILAIISIACWWCLRHEHRAENTSRHGVTHINRGYIG